MAITLMSGTPGSGKSLHAVFEALDWLKFGKNVITNFPLAYDKYLKKQIKGDYEYWKNNDITPQNLFAQPLRWRTETGPSPMPRHLIRCAGAAGL